MKTIGKLIVTGLLIALGGFIFKMTLIPGGNLLLVLSLSFLSILAFIQCIYAIVRIKGKEKLIGISVLMSLTLSITFIGILFRYLWWAGWDFILPISALLFIVVSIMFFVSRKKFMIDEHKKFVRINLLLPWAFIFIFGGTHYALTKEAFYNTFSSQRDQMTYQHFLDNVANR